MVGWMAEEPMPKAATFVSPTEFVAHEPLWEEADRWLGVAACARTPRPHDGVQHDGPGCARRAGHPDRSRRTDRHPGVLAGDRERRRTLARPLHLLRDEAARRAEAGGLGYPQPRRD